MRAEDAFSLGLYISEPLLAQPIVSPYAARPGICPWQLRHLSRLVPARDSDAYAGLPTHNLRLRRPALRHCIGLAATLDICPGRHNRHPARRGNLSVRTRLRPAPWKCV